MTASIDRIITSSYNLFISKLHGQPNYQKCTNWAWNQNRSWMYDKTFNIYKHRYLRIILSTDKNSPNKCHHRKPLKIPRIALQRTPYPEGLLLHTISFLEFIRFFFPWVFVCLLVFLVSFLNEYHHMQ